MKKIMVVLIATLIVLSLAGPAYCGGPLRKLGRGISNILTCPFEFPNRIYKAYKSSGFFAAITRGPIEGCVMVGYRGLAGIDETLTFYIPSGNYVPLIDDPEFFFGPSAKPTLKPDAEPEAGLSGDKKETI